MVANGGVLPKKYGNWQIIYMKFSKWPKNGTIAKAIAFFFTLILEAMKRKNCLIKMILFSLLIVQS